MYIVRQRIEVGKKTIIAMHELSIIIKSDDVH